MDILKHWRERGWTEISPTDYALAYARFGGSVVTHPEIVQRVSQLADIPVRYLGVISQGELIGTIATWDKHLACSRQALKQHGKSQLVDLGNAEVILPLSASHTFKLRHKARFISALHEKNITTLKLQADTLSMARSYHNGDFSRKFKYNQRRELRLLEEAGGELKDICDFSTDELAGWYNELFERRWGFKPKNHAAIAQQLAALREFMFGKIAFLNAQPIAIQLILRAESPQWISVEYINGGVDPTQRNFSAGSALTLVNTQLAEEQALTSGKTLRYSFGKSDAEYKDLWCHRVRVFST